VEREDKLKVVPDSQTNKKENEERKKKQSTTRIYVGCKFLLIPVSIFNNNMQTIL